MSAYIHNAEGHDEGEGEREEEGVALLVCLPLDTVMIPTTKPVLKSCHGNFWKGDLFGVGGGGGSLSVWLVGWLVGPGGRVAIVLIGVTERRIRSNNNGEMGQVMK